MGKFKDKYTELESRTITVQICPFCGKEGKMNMNQHIRASKGDGHGERKKYPEEDYEIESRTYEGCQKCEKETSELAPVICRTGKRELGPFDEHFSMKVTWWCKDCIEKNWKWDRDNNYVPLQKLTNFWLSIKDSIRSEEDFLEFKRFFEDHDWKKTKKLIESIVEIVDQD